MGMSGWSSDVCSSDLQRTRPLGVVRAREDHRSDLSPDPQDHARFRRARSVAIGRVADHLHLAGGGAAQSRYVADRARHLLSAWRATDSGVALAVRVTPRASRAGWGRHDPEQLGVRLAHAAGAE